MVGELNNSQPPEGGLLHGNGDAEQHHDDAQSNQITAFERAFEGLLTTGASVMIRDIVQLLAKHGTDEGWLLSEYEQVSESVNDPAARFLIGLIMDDERRHHRMLVELATAIAWESMCGVGDSVLSLGWHLNEELVAATRSLLEYEHTDRRELQAIQKRLRPFEETTLWGLMIELMMLDTEKHTTILKFLERHAETR